MDLTTNNTDIGIMTNHIWITLGQDDTPGIQATPGGSNGGEALTQDPSGAASGPTAAGGKPASPAPGIPWLLWAPLIFILIFIFWQSSSSQKKEKRKREAMLSAIGKHDKVQTIGGIIGSVVEIKDSEVVLKVDEANNIKMRFAKSAVQQVVTEANSSA